MSDLAASVSNMRLGLSENGHEHVSVVGVPPRRRDFWRVLRGRYRPLVRVQRTITVKGASHIVKDVYSRESVAGVLKGPHLLDFFNERPS